MSENKYIKIMIYPDDKTIFYRVIETRNINFVEPGYEYQIQRPKTFKDLFEPGYLENIEVHLIEDNEARGTQDQPIYVTTPMNDPIQTVHRDE